MGCDIHIVAERLNDAGKWELVGEARREEDGYMRMPEVYGGRNYDLFAMLANVRNGVGFAGCDTGDGFKPIAMPRGVPEDASPEYRAWVERWGVDGHSHSWHTVAQLQAYDWHGQSTRLRGYVALDDYAAWLAGGRGRPRSWCGGVSGGMVKIVSNGEADVLLGHPDARLPGVHYYTKVEWGEAYAESAGGFLTETMPKLLEMGDPIRVRIVFFFDN